MTFSCALQVLVVIGVFLAASCEAGSIPVLQARPIACGSKGAATWPVPGYKLLHNAGYYKFHAYGTGWSMARQVCEQDGAHLVVINSELEAAMLRSLFVENPTSAGVKPADAVYAWVGVHERGTHGQYFTIFGESLSDAGYYHWNTGESNEVGGADCVLFSSKTGGYADNVCTNKFPFICEIELSQVENRRAWLTTDASQQ